MVLPCAVRIRPARRCSCVEKGAFCHAERVELLLGTLRELAKAPFLTSQQSRSSGDWLRSWATGEMNSW
ncbi:hypothetical protein GCM10028775_38180 [Catellatospora paridis]